MPIKAILNGQVIHSFQYSTEKWRELKANYRVNDNGLIMHCCAAPAVPKTSSRGFQFFAHKVFSDCASEAESPEHEYVKFEIAKAVHEFGWIVETEKSGNSIKGDEWRADILCNKGDVKIAFEVQNSQQSWEDIKVRQQRYAESGVRCAWFLNKKSFKIEDNVSRQCREIPAYTYKLDCIGTPTRVDFFNVSAGQFAVELLSKNVEWIDREKYSALSACEHPCWKCHNQTRSILGFDGSNFDDGEELSGCIKEITKKVKLPSDFFVSNKLGIIKNCRYKDGKRFFSPMCFHCQATQGVHQLADDVWNFVSTYNNKKSSLTRLFQVELPSSCIVSGDPVPGYWEHGDTAMR